MLFPTCRSVTYLLTDGEAVLPIPRLLAVEDYLDYVSNRVIPDLAIREALEKLWSASAFMGTEATAERLARVADALDCANACGIQRDVFHQLLHFSISLVSRRSRAWSRVGVVQ